MGVKITLQTVFEYNDEETLANHTDDQLVEMAREVFHQSGQPLSAEVEYTGETGCGCSNRGD